MKKALLALGVLAAGASAYAQGTVTFFNNGLTGATGTYRAGIFRDNLDAITGNSTIGAGAGFTAGLFLASDTAFASPLATITFRTTTAQEVFSSATDVTIPGVPNGATANLAIAAWDGPSFAAAATQRGSQTFTTRGLGGPKADPTVPPDPPTDLGPNFTGFEMKLVPEPSTIALGAVGIGALLLRRRK